MNLFIRKNGAWLSFLLILVVILAFAKSIFRLIQELLFLDREALFLYPAIDFQSFAFLYVTFPVLAGAFYYYNRRNRYQAKKLRNRQPIPFWRKVLVAILLYIFFFLPLSLYFCYVKGHKRSLTQQIFILPYYSQKALAYQDIVACTIDYRQVTGRYSTRYYICNLQFKNKEEIDIGWDHIQYLSYLLSQAKKPVQIKITKVAARELEERIHRDLKREIYQQGDIREID